MFERVLPGRDRMYPDTDSQPIPVTTEMLERLGRNLPAEIAMRFGQMKEWGIPADAWHYLLGKNLVELIERIGNDFGFSHREVGVLLGHRFRSLEGRGRVARGFSYERLYDLFAFLKAEELLPPVARLMLPGVVSTANPDFKQILIDTGYAPASMTEIKSGVKELAGKFEEICFNGNRAASVDWIMGQLHMKAIGKLRLSDVRKEVSEILEVK
jgi:glutamyl-tRNA(Gln) amidotransferase subunit E